MLTITAPGENPHRGLNFVGGLRPPGLCGCEARVVDKGLWNRSSAGRWNVLRTALRRRYGDLVYLRAVEVQKRGLIHLHVIIWTEGPLDLQWVRGEALAAGFGCSTEWAPCVPGSRKAAYYVAKYVTKACDARQDVYWTEIDCETGELVAVVASYRTWSSSQTWGITMREVRAICAAYAHSRAADNRAAEGQAVGPVAEQGPEGGPVPPPPDDPPGWL